MENTSTHAPIAHITSSPLIWINDKAATHCFPLLQLDDKLVWDGSEELGWVVPNVNNSCGLGSLRLPFETGHTQVKGVAAAPKEVVALHAGQMIFTAPAGLHVLDAEVDPEIHNGNRYA